MFKASIIVLLFFTLLTGGYTWFESVHYKPESITAYGKTYHITEGKGAEYGKFDVTNESNRIVYTFYGSTDLFCSGPEIYSWNMDGDAESELYCETCSGNYYLDFKSNGDPVEVNLGESLAPAVQHWSFRIIDPDFFGMKYQAGLFLYLGTATSLLLFLIIATFKTINRIRKQRTNPE